MIKIIVPLVVVTLRQNMPTVNLIFLNNDTIQDPNWVSNLVDTISSNSKIACTT